MSRLPRRAFTLIELLVVITVIGMLMALLMVGVSSVKERMRTAQCQNNMRQIGIATRAIVDSTARQIFPGYSNNINKTVSGATVPSIPVSWGVMILPNLDNASLFDRIRSTNLTSASTDVLTNLRPYLEVFNCPSNPPENFTTASSSMVANCGKSDAKFVDTTAHGIFFNKSSTTTAFTFTMAHIKDGATNTLMFTENVNAGAWSVNFGTSNGPTEGSVGFLWWDSDIQSGTTKAPWRKINGFRITDPNYTGPQPDLPSGDLARPSSNHAGGVNVVFADGHETWLRDDIGYHVYQQLMTPDGANATPVAVDPAKTGVPYNLSEGDYR